MAVLPILTQEAPILRQKAKRVARVDSGIRKLIDDMVDTMIAAPGVGLAAPQVGVGLRVLVIKTDTNLHTLVNPEMVKWEGEQIGLEGCLSVPGYVGEVKRYMQVVARGLNRQGKTVKVKGDALPAAGDRCCRPSSGRRPKCNCRSFNRSGSGAKRPRRVFARLVRT